MDGLSRTLKKWGQQATYFFSPEKNVLPFFSYVTCQTKRKRQNKADEEEKRKSVGLLLSQNASMPQFADNLQPFVLPNTSQVSGPRCVCWMVLNSNYFGAYPLSISGFWAVNGYFALL